MERRSNMPRNPAEMFGGITPSRQAVDLARRAILLGEDPTALTQQAGRAAQIDGKSKVGFFGKAETHLIALRGVVTSIECGKAMDESRRRMNKRNF